MSKPVTQYDLTRTLSPNMDKQFIYTILEYLKTKNLYSSEELNVQIIKIIEKTNMVDVLAELAKSSTVKPELLPSPETLKQKREAVFKQINDYKTRLTPITKLFEDQNLIKTLSSDNNLTTQYLSQRHSIPKDTPDQLLASSKFSYDCGLYSAAIDAINIYKQLQPEPFGLKYLSAQWGKLACEILRRNWESAFKDLLHLKDAIENTTFSQPAELLQQRTWFIHWSLFVFFNLEPIPTANTTGTPSPTPAQTSSHNNGRVQMINIIFQDENYLNTVQTTCPHILRYLALCIITTRRKKQLLKELIRNITLEKHNYSDPILEFVSDLLMNFDFDGAQEKLKACESVLRNDFFLERYADDFMEGARLWIFETYCRIHECIDMKLLAEKLGMDVVSAEKWMVNLIRNAQLDSKIDSAANRVVMNTQYPSPYQQIVDKTKGLAFKSQSMANAMEKLVGDQRRNEGKQ